MTAKQISEQEAVKAGILTATIGAKSQPKKSAK